MKNTPDRKPPVYFDTHHKKHRVKFTLDKLQYDLGYFEVYEDAEIAYADFMASHYLDLSNTWYDHHQLLQRQAEEQEEIDRDREAIQDAAYCGEYDPDRDDEDWKPY